MKILMLHPYSFRDYKGGVERYCHNLVAGLSSVEQVEISYITGNHFQVFGQPLPTPGIIKTIKNSKADIVHLHGPHPFATISALFAKILVKKTVLTYHAPLTPDGFFKKIIVFLDKMLLRFVFNALIVTAAATKEVVGSFFPGERIRIIPLFVEEHFFEYDRDKETCRKELSLSQEEKYVLFVGKLDHHHHYKGVDVLLEAARFLSSKEKIIIIGDGEAREGYEEKTVRTGVEDRVSFKGQVSEEELLKYYRASDVFVLPSTSMSEGFGFVLIEAVAAGLPVVVSRAAGSAKSIKESKAGLVLPDNSPRVLAGTIRKLLREGINQKFSERGGDFSRKFRLENNIPKVLWVYKSVLRK